MFKFLKAARSLVNQGMSKEAIEQFARNEFGEINELFQKQIDNLFKQKQGIENIKIKDEVFDDTIVKLPIDDTGVPFNPKDPMKQYGKPKKTDDFNLSEDDPLGDLEKIIKGEGDTGLPKKPRDEKYTGGLVDVEPSLSDIGHGSDALMARTRLMSPGSQATTSTGLNYLLAEDNDNIRVPFAGGGSDRMKSMTEKEFEKYNEMRDFFNRQQFLKKRREELEMDKKRFEDTKYGVAVAEGGRIGFSKGKAVAKGLGYLMDLFKPKPKVIFDEKRFREGPIDLDFLENIDKKDLEPFIRTRDTKGPGGYGMYDNLADMPAGLQAAELISRIKGPRNTINYEAAEMFIGKKLKGNESVDELIEMLIEKKAEGGRIGFAKGKGVDLLRRGFLKTMGAAGAGIAALKSGLLGLGGKQATKEVAKELITTPAAAGKPPWFDALVTRVIREGDDVTKTMATKDRQNVYRTKIDDETEIMVTQDLDEGVTRIDIDDSTRNVMGYDDPPTVSLQVTDEIVEEGGARIKPEFKATENDYRNYATDRDGGYETEFVENTVEEVKDLTSDLTKVKSFATKKGPTMEEIVISKKKRDDVKYANENPSSYAADRGPQYDPSDFVDDMADDFASGGIARMLGE
jgi:hypothetical protein